MTLRALRPVLYRSTQYRAGDALPADDTATVEAWLEAGSAAWIEDEEAVKAPKAKSRTAVAGMPGLSSDGDREALVGRPKRRRK